MDAGSRVIDPEEDPNVRGGGTTLLLSIYCLLRARLVECVLVLQLDDTTLVEMYEKMVALGEMDQTLYKAQRMVSVMQLLATVDDV